MYPHGACPWNICAKAHYSHAKGARNAETEIVCGIQRGCEYRATQQFARVGTYCTFPKKSILIIALSARPFVEAAVNAGYAVTAIDAFADAQTAVLAEQSLAIAYHAHGFEAQALMIALDSLDLNRFAGFVYGSGFETQPALLAAVAEKLPLFGNTPDTVAAVKTPAIFFAALQQLGIPYPRIVDALPDARPDRYLIKLAGGSGGVHITDAISATPVHNAQLPGKYYYQQKIDGRPVSLLFLANQRDIEVIGFNEQWVSPSVDTPYLYGGAVSNVALTANVEAALVNAAKKLAGRFSLVGLNSLDAIIDAESGQVAVLEINPRLSATVDLYRSTQPNLFERHLRACSNAQVFSHRHDLNQATIYPQHLKFYAHAIVYAPEALVLASPVPWPDWVTDTPPSHSDKLTILAGEPVCTVLADASDAETAKKLAQARVEIVQNLLQSLNQKNVQQ